MNKLSNGKILFAFIMANMFTFSVTYINLVSVITTTFQLSVFGLVIPGFYLLYYIIEYMRNNWSD